MVDIRNVLVLTHIIVGYIFSVILLLTSQQFSIIFPAIVLLTHTLTWSAYMHHELCHNTVFDTKVLNTYFGRILDWINGASYWTFEELKKQHRDHHIYKVDYDFTSNVLKSIEANYILKATLLTCEYFYFPLHSYIFQWRSILAPWWKEERKFARSRTLMVIIIRALYFASLGIVGGPITLLYYLLAYSISIQLTRFTDAFSHSYEVVPIGARRKYLTKSYDMLHTYSIIWEVDENTPLITRMCAQLTHVLLFLNFNFHTQHHYATQKRWFELSSSFEPDSATNRTGRKDINNKSIDKSDEEYIMNNQPDEESSTNEDDNGSNTQTTKNHFVIPLSVALKYFHCHRLNRIFGKSSVGPVLDPLTKRLSLEYFFGVTDASILVLEL